MSTILDIVVALTLGAILTVVIGLAMVALLG